MNRRVLMVDDDHAMASAMSRALSLTFDLSIAMSGAEALELIKDHQFQVIVTDLRMPEMDGVELIQNAREISPESVFILLTGTNDLGLEEYISTAGELFCMMQKPCTMKDIRNTICNAFETVQI